MSLAFCEPVDFILNTRAVPGAYPIYPASEHRASVKSLFKRVMNFLAGIRDPTTSLSGRFGGVEKRKTCNVFISMLFFHQAIIQASAVYPWRRTGFKPVAFKAILHKLFGNTCRCL